MSAAPTHAPASPRPARLVGATRQPEKDLRWGPGPSPSPLPDAAVVAAHQAEARAWFERLRDRICAAFEAIEAEIGDPLGADLPAARFAYDAWDKAAMGGRSPGSEGGGVAATMRGRVFEKVGVNVSTVFGQFSPEFAKEIPGAAANPNYWASGISLVAHFRSPHVPPVHMNTRHIMTTRAWFGGGADLNPIIPDPADTATFHAAFAAACDAHPVADYDSFAAWCDHYFWLKHREEPRGVGGIFFDYLDSGDWAADFAFVRAVGEAFLSVVPAIVRRQAPRTWTPQERAHQRMRRGRYVEYNLLYDRGTRFGLMTGGNTEAILMSLPPDVAWP